MGWDHSLQGLATVVHELRAPLTVLSTSSEVLERDFDRLQPRELRSMVSTIHRRSVWLQNLVENLLCEAAIRRGQLAVRRRSVSLLDVVSEVQPVVEPLLAAKRQRLVVTAPQNLPELWVDPNRIGQVLVNFILNASKFAPPGTPIALMLSAPDGHARVSVSDRGPGLPRNGVDRLFEPFYRARRSSDGFGIGLSVAKSIVEAHGGTLGAANRKSGGARFWFKLPPQRAPGNGAGDLRRQKG